MTSGLQRARDYRQRHPDCLLRVTDTLAGLGGQTAAAFIRDALNGLGVRAATVALPEAATAVTGRIDGAPSGSRVGLYAAYDGENRSPIVGLVGALEALAGDAQATLVLLFDGERSVGSPGLAEYLDTLADRLEADVWIVAGGAGPSGCGAEGGSVRRVLEAAERAGIPVGSSPAFLIEERLGCPTILMPEGLAESWMDLLAELLS